MDHSFAEPGERLTYQIVLAPVQDVPEAVLTDTLPSAVTWAGDISATSGRPSYDGSSITWRGPLTNGTPVTITYGVSVRQTLCSGETPYTDIYTRVYNSAVLDDRQGNTFTSPTAVFTIGCPLGMDMVYPNTLPNYVQLPIVIKGW